MANLPRIHTDTRRLFRLRGVLLGCLGKYTFGPLQLLAAVVLLASLVFAQGSPRVTGIDPASGKVNDSVTVAGENLGKGGVVAVLLSDDKADYKATLVDQSAQKIVVKVPQVKAGDYNVSIQVGNNIFIQPVRFKVQE